MNDEHVIMLPSGQQVVVYVDRREYEARRKEIERESTIDLDSRDSAQRRAQDNN